MTADIVTVQRTIKARPATVFSFFTDRDRWLSWQGVSADIDARPGGIFRMNVRGDGWASGTFTIVDPNRRIAFTWGWEAEDSPVPPGSSTVDITFEPNGDDTLLTLRHSGLPLPALGVHSEGWNHYLDRLLIRASGGDPGPDSTIPDSTVPDSTARDSTARDSTAKDSTARDSTVERQMRVVCACGQAWHGPEGVVIVEVQRHGNVVHNMRVTPDYVRAMAVFDPTGPVVMAGPPVYDVEGPVQAEVFVLYRAPSGPMLTGPCGPAPWYLEVAADEDPMVVVNSAFERAVGVPVVVHSTSWRRDRDGVVLSFVAVISAELATTMPGLPIARADLARGGATTAPQQVATAQVAEHGLRHLAWLIRDDPVVAERLDRGWHTLLEAYVPEPFRHL